jgi:lipopolysaccharide/colanic/teichoic acid biosynthesis glycosyltransferase
VSASTVAYDALDGVDAFVPAQRQPLGVVASPRSGQLAVRVLDLALASLLLVFLAPLFLAIAVAVMLSGPGGAIFRQERVGLHGTTFVMLKFRTMQVDGHHLRDLFRHHDEGNGVLFKIRRDPRVTPVGHVLRRFSLDELPQLINVLRGEMSLVGPRPALPEEVATYTSLVRRRLVVKPGLTGLWQVSGRSDLSWEDSVRLDLQYVEQASLGLNVRILLRTAVAVATARGAY